MRDHHSETQEAERLLAEQEARHQERLAHKEEVRTQAALDRQQQQKRNAAAASSSSSELVLATQPDDDGALLLDLDSRYTMCPQCSESLKQSQLALHLKSRCPRGKIMCPNFHNGCLQKLVPLYMLQQHLLTECAAERHRDAMIASSVHRRGKVTAVRTHHEHC